MSVYVCVCVVNTDRSLTLAAEILQNYSLLVLDLDLLFLRALCFYPQKALDKSIYKQEYMFLPVCVRERDRERIFLHVCGWCVAGVCVPGVCVCGWCIGVYQSLVCETEGRHHEEAQ